MEKTLFARHRKLIVLAILYNMVTTNNVKILTNITDKRTDVQVRMAMVRVLELLDPMSTCIMQDLVPHSHIPDPRIYSSITYTTCPTHTQPLINSFCCPKNYEIHVAKTSLYARYTINRTKNCKTAELRLILFPQIRLLRRNDNVQRHIVVILYTV